MILIGEKLNSSIPKTLEAFESLDERAVVSLINKQSAAGADYLDINTAICENSELERMLWVIDLVKKNSQCGIMIDSTDPDVVAHAVDAAKGRELIINSITLTDRFEELLPIVQKSGASVVGLPIDDDMPHSFAEKCDKIDRLIAKLRESGVSDERIYIDVLVETLATDASNAKSAIDAAAYLAQNYPDVKSTCGLSNISFGLPRRAFINSAFLSAAVYAGLSSAILDPSSPSLQSALAAARAVAGQDDYCMDYITYVRSMEE